MKEKSLSRESEKSITINYEHFCKGDLDSLGDIHSLRVSLSLATNLI